MKVSHELPLSLLKHSNEWNDYDYCLPHLLDKYSTYKEYFLKSRDNGRFIIMDNGLFEGVKHTNEDLIEKINLIKPDIFVVPDAWNDKWETSKNAKYWKNTLKGEISDKTNLMVVIQGKDLYDLISSYHEYVDLGYTHFAFNHSSKAYAEIFPHPNKLVSQMMGRIWIISHLLRDKTIQHNHYIHLLGCSLPQEMIYYGSSFPSVQSVDTSNPIIYGALGKTYNSWGILEKPTDKIESFFSSDLEGKIKDIIFNIQKFRSFTEQKIIF